MSSTNAGSFWERSPVMLQKKKLIKNNTDQKMYNFLHPRRKCFESFQECHRSFSLPISLSLSLCVSHMSTIILLPCSRDWRSVGTCGHVVQCGCLMCTEHVKERLPPKSLQVRGLMWWWRWSILSSFIGRTTTTTTKKNNKTCS